MLSADSISVRLDASKRVTEPMNRARPVGLIGKHGSICDRRGHEMSSNTRASNRLLGCLQTTEGAVRMEERVDANLNDVWSALVKRDHLATWLGEVEGD